MTIQGHSFRSGLFFLQLLFPLEMASAQETREPLPVQIVSVEPAADERELSIVGEVEARELLNASFPASGRIVELYVDRGDHVTKGMTLARIDSTLQEQVLRSAEAALDTARANRQKAKEDADRHERLFVNGTVPRSARDVAVDELLAATAAVKQAEANLDSAQQILKDTILVSPANATVTEKLANLGQVVANAQTVLELAIENRYDAVFRLPETLLAIPPEARPKQVSLTSLDKPDDGIVGTIQLISPLVDTTTGTVKVTVTMPGLPEGLQLGDSIIGTVKWTDAPQIVLPWVSLTVQERKPAVWVVAPDTYKVSLRQIEVQRYETERILIQGGLAEGDLVVGYGAHLLYPDRTVRAVGDK